MTDHLPKDLQIKVMKRLQKLNILLHLRERSLLCLTVNFKHRSSETFIYCIACQFVAKLLSVGTHDYDLLFLSVNTWCNYFSSITVKSGLNKHYRLSSTTKWLINWFMVWGISFGQVFSVFLVDDSEVPSKINRPFAGKLMCSS